MIIPIRRCNLACKYCNEYDETSPPVPTVEMLQRIDRLAALGLSALTFSGGEPLLHPDLDILIRRVRERGMLAGVITNGFLLNQERIERFNRAGLDYLQISIDNVEPDEVSLKSLKTLDSRLIMLAELAEFHVNINSVLGAGVKDPNDAVAVTRRAVELGLTSTVGIIHDGDGQLQTVGERERRIYDRIRRMAKGSYSRINQHNPYQKNLLAGKPNNWWWCRAGGRYLYICEDGLVHYCSQQRGYPGIPLERYTADDIRREYLTKKRAPPTVLSAACTRPRSWIDGAIRKYSNFPVLRNPSFRLNLLRRARVETLGMGAGGVLRVRYSANGNPGRLIGNSRPHARGQRICILLLRNSADPVSRESGQRAPAQLDPAGADAARLQGDGLARARGAHYHRLEKVWIVWDRVLLREWRLRDLIESAGPLFPSILELCYVLVYALPVFCMSMLYVYKKWRDAETLLVIYLLGLFLSYVQFPYWPSEPPRIVFPGEDAPTVDTLLRQFNHWILGGYGIHTSVFPSAHVSGAVAASFAMKRAFRDHPWIYRGVFIYAALVAIATVYGRYHYAVDAVAGVAVGIVAAWLGEWILDRRPAANS